MAPHRREICYVFVDLRGFTAFTDAAEPEEVEAALRKFHGAMGALATQYEGTVDRFAGDGILIFFNDPLPTPDPGLHAAKMALGETLLVTGAGVEAVALLEETAKADPDLQRLQYLLARAYQTAGRSEDARRAFQRYRDLSRSKGDAEPLPPGGRQ